MSDLPLTHSERAELAVLRVDMKYMLAFASDPTWNPAEVERLLSAFVLNRLRDYGYEPAADRTAQLYASDMALATLGGRVLYLSALTSLKAPQDFAEAVQEELTRYHNGNSEREKRRYPNNPVRE